MTVSGDGRVLASGGADGLVRLASLVIGKPSYTFDLGEPVEDVACTGSVVAAAAGRHVHLLHAQAGTSFGRLRLAGRARTVACTWDGTLVAAADDEEVRWFRVAGGRRVGVAREPGVLALEWGEDGDLLGGTVGGEVCRWRGVRDPVERRVAGGPITRLAGGFALSDGAVVGPRGERHGGGLEAFDVLPGGVLLCGSGSGWGLLAGPLREPGVQDLAGHPAGGHVAIVTIDGEVGLLALET